MTIPQFETATFQHEAIGPFPSRRLRILFLAPFAPGLQASHGGGRVIAQLIAHLAQKHSIALCYLRAAGEPAIDDVLRQHCDVVEEVLLPMPEGRDKNPTLGRARVWKELIMGKPLWAIDRWSPIYGERVETLLKTWKPDIVQVEFHIMGQYLPALSEYPAPRVLVQHEPGVEAAREAMTSIFTAGRITPQLDLLAWRRFERKVIQQVQAVVVFTERDRDVMSRLDAAAPVVRIPFATEIPEHLSNASEDAFSVLFVGNFKHLPNVDAADRLINNIFTQVQSQIPEARLLIVGDNLPSQLLKQANGNIIATGYVPNLKPYLEQATLVVVPIRLGGGMRVKVLEALAAGKAIIASSRAVAGLDLVNGEHVIVAEDDAEFSRAIVDLLTDPQKRSLLATRAREWAYKNLSWEKTVLGYEQLYYRLIRDASSSRS